MIVFQPVNRVFRSWSYVTVESFVKLTSDCFKSEHGIFLQLEHYIGQFVTCRNICQMPEEGPSRQPLMMLLEEMYKLQPCIGYHFLYFLKVR